METDPYDEQHLELINKHFSLKIKTAGRSFRENDIFLCIPWDLNVKNPGVGSLCHSISAEAEGEIHAGYYDNVQEFSCGQAYFVDHDLRVTKNKVILINKAIRDMQLEVSSTQRARFTKSEVSSTTSDFKFKQEDNPNGGKLWWPRVIALQEVHLELQEGQEENNY